MAEDLLQLQQAAARRVKRMQEHSRQVFEEHQGRTAESLAAARPPQAMHSPGLCERPCPPEKTEPNPPAPPSGGLLAGLDTEQLLLLSLALLLFRNGCRPELVVALLYLAM